jgi:hypothetical protein
MPLAEALRVSLKVARILEDLAIPYLVGGSLASSLHGIPRTTHDVDMVADLRVEHVEPFLTALGSDFYVSPQAVTDAVANRGSFNLIDQETILKIDIFVLKEDRLSKAEMTRSVTVELPADSPQEWPPTLVVASAEDIVLQKLLWYRLGQGVSDRQWRDVLGVIKVQAQRLDFAYLEQHAERSEIHDLLSRAFREAGRPLGDGG